MMHEVEKVFTSIVAGFEDPDFGWVDSEEYDVNVTILYNDDNVAVIIDDDYAGTEILKGGAAIKFLIETNLRDKAK